jgi:Mlc titration factor MtfA (ptsG expression regulator)
MSGTGWPLLLAVPAATALLVLIGVLRTQRRRRQIRQPFPAEWRARLLAASPLYRRLPPLLRTRLEPLVREFLLDVEFVGCAGLTVSDDMRLTVAAQACLLLLGHGAGAYRLLRSVLLYPEEFVVDEAHQDEAGVVTEGTRVLSGQSFETSRIILSWRDVQESSWPGEAYNVVLHEFAHYLDHSVGGALTERPSRRRSLQRWHAVLEREYRALCAAVARGERTLIDPYGAEHLEEFFAVATETFFEQPRELQRQHPHLYAELRGFYALDPAAWPVAG